MTADDSLASPSPDPRREDFRTALAALIRTYALDVTAERSAEEIARVMDEARIRAEDKTDPYRHSGTQPVGSTFTDHDGCQRVSTPFGFNAYVTQDGAVTGATGIGRNGSTWYIWRLSDGSYDFTATENPDIPGHPAELVETITVNGYGAKKKAVRHA